MLRLKPTEIVLAPADIELARQRMERRRADRLAQVPVPGRPRAPLTYPVGVQIKRGAQRSRDAAVASLGTIPILRPHQVIRASVDDDLEPNPEASVPQDDNANRDLPTLDFPQHLQSLGSFQLPFRSVLRTAASEDIPLKLDADPSQSERDGVISEGDHDTASPGRMHASTDGSREPLDTIETPVRTQTYNLDQNNNQTPSLGQQPQTMSPLRHGHDLTPINRNSNPRHPDEQYSNDRPTELSQRSGSDNSATLQLHGYFNDQHGYTFKEVAPQTEPRPKPHPAIRSRAVSSLSDPSHSSRVQRSGAAQSSVDDVFWIPLVHTSPPGRHTLYHTAASTTHPHVSPNTEKAVASEPTRNFSQSEQSSSSSLPYSFYELPGSQHSNSDQSQGDLELSQYDGAAASRQTSRGAYHSIRLNGYRSPTQTHSEQQVSSRMRKSPTPQTNLGDRTGLSPLPVHPYSRASRAQSVLRPSIGLLTSDDVLGTGQDALTAVQRNTSSPLDLVQERATSYMHRISAQVQTNRAQSNAGVRPDVRLQHWNDDTQQPVHHRMTLDGDGPRWPPANFIPSRPNAGSHHQVQYGMQYPRYVPDPQVRAQDAFVHRGNAYKARVGQRSSENVPVGIPMQDAHPPRGSHMPDRHGGSQDAPPHLTGTEVRNSGRPAGNHVRYSLPQPPRPRDASNRSHITRSPRSVAESDGEASSGPVDHAPMEGHLYPAHGMRGPRSQAGHAFRPEEPLIAHLTTRRARPSLRLVTPTRRPSAVPPTYLFHRSLSRGPPSTSTTMDMAAGVTSRRPPSVSLAMPHAAGGVVAGATGTVANGRRIMPARQQDQENSGEAEREMEIMRGELAVVGVRYGGGGVEGGDAGLDRMDETPPRIGRIERRMGG